MFVSSSFRFTNKTNKGLPKRHLRDFFGNKFNWAAGEIAADPVLVTSLGYCSI